MLYYDPDYILHMDKWNEMKIPYIGQSERTELAFFSQDVVSDTEQFAQSSRSTKPGENGYDLDKLYADSVKAVLASKAEQMQASLDQSEKDGGVRRIGQDVLEGGQEAVKSEPFSPTSAKKFGLVSTGDTDDDGVPIS